MCKREGERADVSGVRTLLMGWHSSPMPLLVSFLDSVEVGRLVRWADRHSWSLKSSSGRCSLIQSVLLQLCGAVAKQPQHFGTKPCLCVWPSNLSAFLNHLTTVVMALVILRLGLFRGLLVVATNVVPFGFLHQFLLSFSSLLLFSLSLSLSLSLSACFLHTFSLLFVRILVSLGSDTRSNLIVSARLTPPFTSF